MFRGSLNCKKERRNKEAAGEPVYGSWRTEYSPPKAPVSLAENLWKYGQKAV